LADKFNSIFEESFGDAFGDFITGTKSAKEAFTDFANSVANQISRIAAQEVATQIFGSGGLTGGGIGSLFAGLFSGGGQNLAGVFATGTDYVPATGLAMVHKGERIVPASENNAWGGGRSVTVQNTFVLPPGGMTRETQSQVASAATRSLTVAARRFN
jgi:hypothetical protein